MIELAGNGHVDGLALLLLVAAVLALRRDRRGWAGVLIGLATMVKLYPAIAVAAWWRRGRWRMAIAAAAVCAVAYAPHVMAVGTRVLGYLPGYLKEEHYTSGSRFVLLGILGLPGPVTTALAIAILAAVTVHVARAGYEPAAGLVAVLGALILITTPVQPWYAVTVAGLGALAGLPWLAVLGLAAEPYYAAIVLADAHQVAAGRISYGAAFLLMAGFGLFEIRRRGRRPATSRLQARDGGRGALPVAAPHRPVSLTGLTSMPLMGQAVERGRGRARGGHGGRRRRRAGRCLVEVRRRGGPDPAEGPRLAPTRAHPDRGPERRGRPVHPPRARRRQPSH